ncbi:hypothetical protein CHGG_04779 [Chaetomium globosum CBS 148.51]|uniref:Uncharacterized protein n=1 Tax=Chaetomium globosum (strain ATCC 6205 / CBS 148.51 / DSM 1962 / NBRC 6347 / NRRL 1970) TaxID=306901 RepID=Q2H0B7_CHAGB|nr:uncharacterized protein CHGG_04779 [Chaetomium globosum CBS 148.51]EAQ88160.1 hypothetical protein CHGG_04779 [Chaetomium globosum CBS 148.51]
MSAAKDAVGRDPQLNEGWFNNHTVFFIPQAQRDALTDQAFAQNEVIFQHGGLRVLAAPWKYAFCCKIDRLAGGGVAAAQSYDLSDAVHYLARYLAQQKLTSVPLATVKQWFTGYSLRWTANNDGVIKRLNAAYKTNVKSGSWSTCYDLELTAPPSSAIYFDSYLPSSKRPERIQRLIKLTGGLIRYQVGFQTGVPRAINPHRIGEANVDLFPDTWPSDKKASLRPPVPPFLVPAVIDALRNSPKFGPLISLVPGEADGFCAQHVREHGGMVLTSDSDLLAYRLGEAGGVIFLTDIDGDMENRTLSAPQYRLADLCRRLSIKPDTGIQHLAFEISRDPHLTLEQAVERTKRGEAASVSEEEYSKFISEYLSPEVALTSETNQASALDPRVSEIALRSLQTSGIVTFASKDDSPSQDPKDSRLEMYLPFLLDYPSRTSAWEASKRVRQLAYAVLLSCRKNDNIPTVFEMRRLQSISSGLEIEVPASSEIDSLGTSLLALVSKIETSMGKPELKWVILAIYQDIVMTMDREGYPLSLELLRQDARGKLDPCSWDFIHLLAQVQATYYSLRMLHQILEFSKHRAGALTTTLSELSQLLSRLPPLTDFPSLRTFEGTLSSVREEECLSCLEALCADFEDAIFLIKSVRQPQNSRNSKKRKNMASDEGESKPRLSNPRSNNPFDLLAGTGD